MNLQKVIIYAALLLDVIGIAVLIPAFPELKSYYGISDLQVSLGFTVYSLCAFLSAPVLGQISDKIGRKKSLIWCVIGTFISYAILLITQQYWMFIVSRIINGITGGNISILQAVLRDISPDEETRRKNFGLMGAFFGLGFIVGPLIGALLLKTGSVTNIFRFGAIFALIEIVLIITNFSNTNQLQPEKALTYNSFEIMWKYLKKPDLRNILISLFFLGIGGFIVVASQSLYMHSLFGTNGSQYGVILAASGVLSALNFGVLIPKFWMKTFSHKALVILCHVALIIGYGLTGLSTSLLPFLVFFYLTTLFGSIYSVVYNVIVMGHADPKEVGEISGMIGGAQSLFMFVGPLIGGLLLQWHINIYAGSIVCFALSAAVMIRYIVRGGLD